MGNMTQKEKPLYVINARVRYFNQIKMNNTDRGKKNGRGGAEMRQKRDGSTLNRFKRLSRE